MQEDDLDLFPDRDELLSGVGTKRADALLYLIEARTARAVERARQAAQLFVGEDLARRRDVAYLEAFALGRDLPRRPSVQELELHASDWAFLVPDTPRTRAALAHRLGERYRLTPSSAPRIRAALGLDDPRVRKAYGSLYGEPLESIYAEGIKGLDRLRWRWTALAAWLDELAPFWKAFALTLTETVGATILALPIALASVGPIGGVVVVVALGIVNIVTIALMSESVTRSGPIRTGGAYIGRLVSDYLGTLGSFTLSIALFVVCLLVLPAFMIGVGATLEDSLLLPTEVWIAALFAVDLYFLRRQSLNATVSSALVVGAVNIGLILSLSVLGLLDLKASNLTEGNIPFIGGNAFDPSVLSLIFGVVLAAYFGHTSVVLCGRLVLRRDSTGRSLLWGCAAAQATAMALYCLFAVAVNGAVGPERLVGHAGTALSPLADEVGGLVLVFGSLFVVLGMGMGSIHFSLALFNLVRERLPSEADPTLLLPARRGALLFTPRFPLGNRAEMALVYLGIEGGRARFRAEARSRRRSNQHDFLVEESWEASQNPQLADLLAGDGRPPKLRLEVLEANMSAARVRVATSLRLSYRGDWESVGLAASGLLFLEEEETGIVTWMLRMGEVGESDLAAHLGVNVEVARETLGSLERRGLVKRVSRDGSTRYSAATRGRARRLAEDISAALMEGPSPGTSVDEASPPRRLGDLGRLLVATSPVVAVFLAAEWMVVTGRGSFSGILGFVGVLVVPLFTGILPVLLLTAGRRKGRYRPGFDLRFLANRWLLGGLYALYLAAVLLHGLVIWEELWQRVAAVAASVGTLALTGMLVRRGAFDERITFELEPLADRVRFTIARADGETPFAVRLEYPEGARSLTASHGDIARFASLQRASFRPVNGATSRELKLVLRAGESRDADIAAIRLRVDDGRTVQVVELGVGTEDAVLSLGDGAFEIRLERGSPETARVGL